MSKTKVKFFLRQNIFLLGIIILVLAISASFLSLGFGSDADAWRVANTAKQFFQTGEYSASRLPGYPLYEIMVSPFVMLGPFYSNLFSLLIFIASIFIFIKISSLYSTKNKKILIILFSFFPLFLMNAVTTMDYIPALFFILLSFYFLLKKKYALSSVALAAAVGARITSSLFIIPFFYYLWKNDKNYILKYLSLFGFSSILFFTPVILKYGPFHFLQPGASRYWTLKELINFVIIRSIGSVGLLAITVIIIFVVSKYKSFVNLIKKADHETIFFLLVLIPHLLMLFITIPEPEYLLPIFPFLFLFLDGKLFDKEMLTIVTITCLLFSVFQVTKIILIDDKIKIVWEPGILMNEYKWRRWQHKFAYNICKIFPDNERGEVIVGSNSPQIIFYNSPKCKNKEVYFRYLIEETELLDLISQGYKIYYMEGLELTTKQVYGYDLKNSPAQELKYEDIINYK